MGRNFTTKDWNPGFATGLAGSRMPRTAAQQQILLYSFKKELVSGLGGFVDELRFRVGYSLDCAESPLPTGQARFADLHDPWLNVMCFPIPVPSS